MKETLSNFWQDCIGKAFYASFPFTWFDFYFILFYFVTYVSTYSFQEFGRQNEVENRLIGV